MSAEVQALLVLLGILAEASPAIAEFIRGLAGGSVEHQQRIADILPEHSESEAAEALILAQDAAHKTDPAPAPKL